MKLLYIIPAVVIIMATSCSHQLPTNRTEFPQVTTTRDANESEGKSRITPASVGAIQLTQSNAFPEKYREASSAVAQELIKDKENPVEFYAEIEPVRTGLIFHLWHEDAFKEENKGVEGNPGGKCRDLHYNVKQQRVTDKRYWQ